jgi:hypothetical protein
MRVEDNKRFLILKKKMLGGAEALSSTTERTFC